MTSEERRLNGGLTVREFERITNEIRRAYDQWREDHMKMHTLEEVARTEAKSVIAKDLEHLNALRQDVVKDRGDFINRDIYERDRVTLLRDLSDQGRALKETEGKVQLLLVMMPTIILAVGAAVAILEFLHK